MLKLFKTLFLLCLILIIGFGVWGYNNGVTKDNYKDFISELIAKYQSNEPSIAEKEIEPKKEIKKPTVRQKEEEGEYALLPLPINPFSTIDQHARNASSSDESDINSLANYLQQNTKTDLEKTRAIYVWIAENVRYDDEAFNSGVYPTYTPEYVFQNRKAVCGGFANLYVALGEEMGLKIEKVSGFAKGYGYQVGSRLSKADHAWNIININGKWRIFDSTWGAGHGKNVNGKLVSTQEFNEYWFNLSPYESIFNHYPENNALAFVQPSLSFRQYEQMAKIEGKYFELGFSGKEIYSMVRSNPGVSTPEVYKVNTYVKMLAAPQFKTLNANQSYEFEFFIPRAFNVATIDSKNEWTHFQREKGYFKLSLTPQELGKLKISVQHENSGKSFETILIYTVESGKEFS